MPVSTLHEDYKAAAPLWIKVRDALKGSDYIKSRGAVYLPKSSGMAALEASNPQDALTVYEGYKLRAEYPAWVHDSKKTSLGLVSRLAPVVENLPQKLEYLLHDATSDGFGLDQFWMRLISELMIGRVVAITDIDDQQNPYFALYTAESCINWKERATDGRYSLGLVVFKEQKNISEDMFSHETEEQYRVYYLDDAGHCLCTVFGKDERPVDDKVAMPLTKRGGKPFDFIPVVFGGSIRNSVDIDESPLLPISEAALTAYRLSADYHQELHLTSHAQPYTVGGWDIDDNTGKPIPPRVSITGSMVVMHLPSDTTFGYAEITGVGIEAKRQAIKDKHNEALEAGAKVTDASGGVESGDARKARQNDHHASLQSIVKNATLMVQQLLRYAAEAIGMSEEQAAEITYKVDVDFTELAPEPQLLAAINNAVTSEVLPLKAAYEYALKTKLIKSETTFDEYVGMIDSGASYVEPVANQ